MGYPIVIAEGVEGWFIALVIIGSFIGRIVKASRDAKAGQDMTVPPPPPPSTRPRSPNAELKQFLESLVQGQAPAPPPPPAAAPRLAPRPVVATQPTVAVAPPAPVRPVVPQDANARVHQKKFAKPVTAQAAAPRATSHSPQQARPAPPRPVVLATSEHEETLKAPAAAQPTTRTSIQELLKGKDALRNAVILREILGPPLALRSCPVGGQETD